MDRQQRHRWIFTGLNFLLIAGLIFLASQFYSSAGPKQVSYSEFLDALRSGKLSEVEISEKELVDCIDLTLKHSVLLTPVRR